MAVRNSRDFHKSNEYFEKAINLKGINEDYLTVALSNYASNLFYMEEFQKSIENNRKILSLKGRSKKTTIFTYNTLTKCFVELEKIDSAQHYLDLFHNELSGKNGYYYTYLVTSGDVEFLAGDYQKSLNTYTKALNLYKKNRPTSINTINSINECILKTKIKLIGDEPMYQDLLNFINSTDTVNNGSWRFKAKKR